MVKNYKDIENKLSKNSEKIKGFGTRRIGIFGSFLKNEQKENSDIDILVDFFPDKKNYDNYINLYYFLQDLFQKKDDIVTESS